MAILTTLEAENRAMAEAKEDEEKEDRLGALMKRSEARKREKYSGCFDIIEPVKATTGGQNQAKGRRRNSLSNHPRKGSACSLSGSQAMAMPSDGRLTSRLILRHSR
jgi:hypothetical protein